MNIKDAEITYMLVNAPGAHGTFLVYQDFQNIFYPLPGETWACIFSNSKGRWSIGETKAECMLRARKRLLRAGADTEHITIKTRDMFHVIEDGKRMLSVIYSHPMVGSIECQEYVGSWFLIAAPAGRVSARRRHGPYPSRGKAFEEVKKIFDG